MNCLAEPSLAANAQSDWQLLRQYVGENSESAFTELVQRHLNLVYSVAYRHCSDRRLAEEVANTVFVTLAQKARTLKSETILAGWLFKAARYIATNTRNFEARRASWSENAARDSFVEPAGCDSEVVKAWEIVGEQLDLAVAELNDSDRNAILQRFYESKSLREIGHAAGISEEAARKRTARALEKLRKTLSHRGVKLPASALALTISTYSAQAAPADLPARIASTSGGDTVVPDLPAHLFQESPLSFPQIHLRYISLSLLVGAFVAIFSFLHFTRPTAAPREVFHRQTQAVLNGDGDAYVQMVLFSNAEENDLRRTLGDSIRTQFKLRTTLVNKFGPGPFAQSQFPRFFDLFDTNQIAKATATIQGNQATLQLPWGSRLPFVKQGGQWKLDYFHLPGMPTASVFAPRVVARNAVLQKFNTDAEAGNFRNIDEAYRELQSRLQPPPAPSKNK